MALKWGNQVGGPPLTKDSLRQAFENIRAHADAPPVRFIGPLDSPVHRFHTKMDLLCVLRALLQRKLPYYLRRDHQASEWVTHRCLHIARKGQQEFMKLHC